MKRFLRAVLCLVPATLTALVLGVRPAAPDLLSSISLSCSDGTALNLTLSATELLGLADAVSAINLYPAGDPPLTCSLTQSSPLSWSTSARRLLALLTPNEAAASGNPVHDYAVGGGQVQQGFCTINFALSAHVDDTDAPSPPTSGGTFNLTQQQSPLMPSVCPGGHLVAKPDCLHVEGNVAQLSATITHSDGSFSSFAVGSKIYVEAVDNDPDMIGWTATSMAMQPCNACPATTMPLLHGNVSVHDADCVGCPGAPCVPTTTSTSTTTTTSSTTTTTSSTTTTTSTTSTTTSTIACLNTTPPACAGASCTCGGDCSSQFCDLSGGSPGVCAPVCADKMPPCECDTDCTSGFCGASKTCEVSPGPSGACGCGGDCTSQNCQGGTCQTNCAGGPCVFGTDCSSGSCVGTSCAAVSPGGTCGCGGDCTSQNCQGGTCKKNCAPTGSCMSNADCSSNNCNTVTHLCAPGSFGDPCGCGGDCAPNPFCDNGTCG